MEKIINTEDGDVILINSIDEYDYNTFTINKGYMENGEVKKIITLKRTCDFLIDGWIDSNDETNILTFDFEENDPLYNYLDNLIGECENFILDDDLTSEENKKIISIKKENKKIILSIINNLSKNYSIDKFSISIINTYQYDGRSKIDHIDSNIREKLNRFFSDIENDIIEQKVYTK